MGMLLAGCGPSEKEMKAASEIQTQIKASGCSVTVGEAPGGDKGSQEFIELNYSGIIANHQTDKCTSSSAFNFYKSDSGDISKYDMIIVNLSDGSSSFKKSYQISEIKIVDSLRNDIIPYFFQWYTTDSVRSVLDSRFADSTLNQIISFLQVSDAAQGKLDKFILKGWYIASQPKSNESLLNIYIGTQHGRYITDYCIVFSTTTKKITAITLLREGIS